MNGFGVVLVAVGSLAIWLFGYDLPEGVLTQAGSSDRQLLIWPALGPDVLWPPRVSLRRENDLRDLAATVPRDTLLSAWPGK